MMQCMDCGEAINPEAGPRVPLGEIEYIIDRHGNKVIAYVRCQPCLEKTEVV